MLSRFLLLVTAAAALAGCGKQGDLQRPGPVFGQPRAVFPSDLTPGAADETSTAENEDEDRTAGTPAPNEDARPRDPNVPVQPAAPVNIPPTAG